MEEIAQILDAARQLRERHEDAVLATIVATDGSTYRRPGARMLIARSGRVAGGISGGCLESDVVRKAWWRTEAGPSVVTYDSRTDEDDPLAWAWGLGCNGIVQVLLERIPVTPKEDEDTLKLIAEVYASRRPAAIAVAYGEGRCGHRLLVHPNGRISGRLDDPAVVQALEIARLTGVSVAHTEKPGEPVFVEAVLPPPALVLFGGGPDVAALSQMAVLLGWQVSVVVSGPTPPDTACFPGASVVSRTLPPLATLDERTAVVLMSHSLEADANALAHFLPARAGYIGLLGPRRRAERLCERTGGSLAQDARLHAPVGLDIGAEGGAAIAVSIIAEVQAHFAGRKGTALRERTDTIHGRTSLPSVPQPGSGETVACGLAL